MHIDARPFAASKQHALHLKQPTRRVAMLWTIFVVLLILWALGLISGYTLGGFIHILLVIALAAVLIRIIQGRRPV
jgi:hypothetical protein